MAEEGTPDTGTDQQGTEDTDAQQALAAAQEADQQDKADEDALDPKSKAKIEKANREAQSLRKRLKELAPLAARAQELEDAQKTETQKLSDQLAAAQVELAGYRVASIRHAAAQAAGLPADLAEFITAADEDSARAQAETLAARFAAAQQSAPADFRQGARQQPPKQLNSNDLLRQMAGH